MPIQRSAKMTIQEAYGELDLLWKEVMTELSVVLKERTRKRLEGLITTVEDLRGERLERRMAALVRVLDVVRAMPNEDPAAECYACGRQYQAPVGQALCFNCLRSCT